MIHRCTVCHWPIWPWQRFGFLFYQVRVEYWHAHHYPELRS